MIRAAVAVCLVPLPVWWQAVIIGWVVTVPIAVTVLVARRLEAHRA